MSRLRRAGRASRGPLNADVRWHMKACDKISGSVDGQYYELGQFLGSYLHQDWMHDYDCWERAVDHAFADSTPDRVQRVLKQLEQLLALQLAGSDLANALLNLNCYYCTGRSEDCEPWLRAVVSRLRERVSTNAI